MSADVLSMIMKAVRDEMPRMTADERTALEERLARAEQKVRRSLGGTEHYISRLPRADALQLIRSLPPDLTLQQIVDRTGMSKSTASRLRALDRRTRKFPDFP